jgi:subtilisin family serine protease
MDRRVALVLAVAALAACSEPLTRPPAVTPPVQGEPTVVFSRAVDAQVVPDQYIVVFDDDVADPPGVARRLATQHAAEVHFTYSHALKGFAARLSAQAASALARHPNVAYVEQDRLFQIDATQTNPTWGIDRIDERSLPLSGTYTYTASGAGVRAYIIDTGIQASHSQFGSRASNVYDYAGGSGNDCHGHGTHVAGTVGSSTYGVAKSAYLRGVRVLNCAGSGTTSAIVAGIDWVRANHVKPAVANLSLGGGFSSALNTAVTNLANAGVFVAVAAGNSNANACNYSPASASVVTTVAASTSSDAKASYSNYGSCVDLYAPGSSITSTWINSSTRTISGTSMASPHVAGVAALYKHSRGDASQSTIDGWIKTNATTGVISGNPSGTPNRLLYKSTL